MPFRGSNASGGRIVVLLPSACWAHRASKIAISRASLLLCIVRFFWTQGDMLAPGPCRTFVLPPGALLYHGTLRLLACTPNPSSVPHLGFWDWRQDMFLLALPALCPLNVFNKDKEAKALVFKTRKWGFQSSLNLVYLVQNSPIALPTTSLHEEVTTPGKFQGFRGYRE